MNRPRAIVWRRHVERTAESRPIADAPLHLLRGGAIVIGIEAAAPCRPDAPSRFVLLRALEQPFHPSPSITLLCNPGLLTREEEFRCACSSTRQVPAGRRPSAANLPAPPWL